MTTPNNTNVNTDTSEENLMKQYQMMVDVYKFHFDIVLKFITFYYAITGAILSFYLSQPKTNLMNAALALPIIMGCLFAAFAFFGAKQVDTFTLEISAVTDHLHLDPFPNNDLLGDLKLMLIFTGVLSSLTAIGLLIGVLCLR